MASLLRFPKNANANPSTANVSLGGGHTEVGSPTALSQGGVGFSLAGLGQAGARNLNSADLSPAFVRQFVDQINKPHMVGNVIPLHARTSGRNVRILLSVVHAMSSGVGAARGSALQGRSIWDQGRRLTGRVSAG